MKWAKRQGYIDRNTVADLEVPSAEHKEVAISQEEFDHLLSYVRNQALADLLIVTWETGCQPQESLRVAARHVDLVNQRWVFYKSESKMKRITRVVYLTDPALAITKRLMLARPDGRLFCNTNGKPWNTEAVNCCFFLLQMRMGIEEMKKRGERISPEEIAAYAATLRPTRTRKGVKV
jgi:integrase